MGRALVIGASGYLGGRLLREPFADRMVGTFHKNKQKGLEYLDLRDRDAIIRLLDSVSPDLVLFPAGITSVDECEVNPELAFQVNAEAVKTIAARPGVRVIYYSTDYVFDGGSGSYFEDSRPNPINVYGRSKLLGEASVLGGGSRNLVLRVSGLYGPSGQEPDPFYTNLYTGEVVLAEDDRISSPVFLDDVASATKLLLRLEAAGIFHVAGPLPLSRYEFQQLLYHFSPSNRKVIPTTAAMIRRRAPRPGNTSLATKRMTGLGFRCRTAAEGLRGAFSPTAFDSELLRRESLLAEMVDKAEPEAVLLDCIGGLLTERKWLRPGAIVDSADRLCGQLVDETGLVKRLEADGLSRENIIQIQEQVVRKYAPNPSVWSCLKSWKGRYKLVLANDGLPTTFLRWVKLYGLDLIFDELINSSEVGLRKSNPDFYSYISKRIGVHTTRCLLIDDDEVNISVAKGNGLAVLKTRVLNKYPLLEHGV